MKKEIYSLHWAGSRVEKFQKASVKFFLPADIYVFELMKHDLITLQNWFQFLIFVESREVSLSMDM